VKAPFSAPDDETPEASPSGAEPKPMAPLDRRRLRSGHAPQVIPLAPIELVDEEDESEESEFAPATPTVRITRTSRQDMDPVFGYILAMALGIGLLPIPDNARYVILWAFLALMGGMAFLLGSGIQFKISDPGDLLWGIGVGVVIGGGVMIVGGNTLTITSERLFAGGQKDNPLLNTWVFQATVFVMPVSEGLFFRGALQRVHPIPVVALLASVWSIVLFFPNLGLGRTPAVGFVMGTALVALNFLYSYVHFRHGLAASFFCQISAGTLILLVPRLISL